jgi:hypothetical protein
MIVTRLLMSQSGLPAPRNAYFDIAFKVIYYRLAFPETNCGM